MHRTNDFDCDENEAQSEASGQTTLYRSNVECKGRFYRRPTTKYSSSDSETNEAVGQSGGLFGSSESSEALEHQHRVTGVRRSAGLSDSSAGDFSESLAGTRFKIPRRLPRIQANDQQIYVVDNSLVVVEDNSNNFEQLHQPIRLSNLPSSSHRSLPAIDEESLEDIIVSPKVSTTRISTTNEEKLQVVVVDGGVGGGGAAKKQQSAAHVAEETLEASFDKLNVNLENSSGSFIVISEALQEQQQQHEDDDGSGGGGSKESISRGSLTSDKTVINVQSNYVNAMKSKGASALILLRREYNSGEIYGGVSESYEMGEIKKAPTRDNNDSSAGSSSKTREIDKRLAATDKLWDGNWSSLSSNDEPTGSLSRSKSSVRLHSVFTKSQLPSETQRHVSTSTTFIAGEREDDSSSDWKNEVGLEIRPKMLNSYYQFSSSRAENSRDGSPCSKKRRMDKLEFHIRGLPRFFSEYYR